MLSCYPIVFQHTKQTYILLLCYPCFPTFISYQRRAYHRKVLLLCYLCYPTLILLHRGAYHPKILLLCYLCYPTFLYTSNRRLSCCAIFAILPFLHIKQTPILLCHLCYPTFFTHQTGVYQTSIILCYPCYSHHTRAYHLKFLLLSYLISKQKPVMHFC